MPAWVAGSGDDTGGAHGRAGGPVWILDPVGHTEDPGPHGLAAAVRDQVVGALGAHGLAGSVNHTAGVMARSSSATARMVNVPRTSAPATGVGACHGMVGGFWS